MRNVGFLGRRCPQLLFALSAVPALWALDPKLAITQYAHAIWTTANGLPQNSVRSIAQTTDGYLWMATQNGLARFDGVSFTVFNSQNTPGWICDRIAALVAGSDGTLWIGTVGEGVVRYKDGRFTGLPGTEKLPDRNVRALHIGAGGAVWIGTELGLAKYQDGKLATIFSGPKTKAHVHCLAEYPAGTMWAGTNAGLAKLEGPSLTTYTTRDGLPGNSIWSIAPGKDGEIWVGSRPGGLSVLRNGRFHTYTTRDGLTHNAVTALRTDRDGNLWIGTDGGGLNRYYRGKFTSYQTREGLPNQVVRSIFEDQEGSIWLGTAGGGVSQIKDSPFTVRSMREDMPSDVVRSIYQDRWGSIWLGTGNGPARIVDGR